MSFGLASLVQRQQKAMGDIERKYAPKKMAAYLGGGSGLAVAATVLILPSLAPLFGVAAPVVAAVGGGILGFGKDTEVADFIAKAAKELSSVQPFRLVEYVHDKHSAWHKHYHPGVRGITIPHESVIEENRSRAKAKKAKTANAKA